MNISSVNNYTSPSNLVDLIRIPNKGRCVVATQDIPFGTTVEIAPVCVLTPKERIALIGTNVFTYYFVQPNEYQQPHDQIPAYIAFGIISICSHSDNPNSIVIWSETPEGTICELRTAAEIKKGQELTIFYTNIEEYPNREEFT